VFSINQRGRRWTIGALCIFGLPPLVVGASALTSAAPVQPEPVTAAVVGAATTPIRHVVVIYKENRSFDEYFGTFPGARGATTALTSSGQVVPLARTPDPVPNDLGHTPGDFKKAYDGGRMDGFDKEAGAVSATGQPLALSQMTESQIPNYWAYARTYGLADNAFADWKGASFANNLYEISGQAGVYDPSLAGATVYMNPASPTVARLKYWGCDDPADTRVQMRRPDGSLYKTFPCFGFRALPNILAEHQISWNFFANAGTNNFRHNALDALTPVRRNAALWSRIQPTSTFMSEAKAGTLPAVSWLVANRNEHPVDTSCAGENETVSWVNAIMSGSDWSSTAIFVIWDEWGGFYDHVKPPQIDGQSFGFRVPLLVISPYTMRGTSSNGGYISHTLYSNVSTLKFIEANWQLPSLTPHDAAANSIMDMFDFSAATRRPKLMLTPRTCPALTTAQRRTLKAENPD